MPPLLWQGLPLLAGAASQPVAVRVTDDPDPTNNSL